MFDFVNIHFVGPCFLFSLPPLLSQLRETENCVAKESVDHTIDTLGTEFGEGELREQSFIEFAKIMAEEIKVVC